MLGVATFVAAPSAVVAETVAGTAIVNTATVTIAGPDGGERRIVSNPVTVVVAERLDLTLAGAADPVSIANGGSATVAATLVNTGNGVEAFVLAATASERVAVSVLAIDTDGDGAFDPASDTVLADGGTPALAPGAALRLLVVLRADAAPVEGDRVTVTARAATASGAPGTTVAAAGDGGGDAVVGATGATATIARPLVASDGPAAPTLVKSATILAPDGSAHAVSGAAVTYVLTARFPAPTPAARIDDPVPAGTRYLAGSLSLDGAALTDATGDDAGEADATAVAVTLGALPADATRTVRFTVILP